MAFLKRRTPVPDPYMTRDPEHPDTWNPVGHTDREMIMLIEMRSAGIDLDKPRKVHFYIVCDTDADAEAAFAELEGKGFTGGVRPADQKVPIPGLVATRTDRGLVPLLAEVSTLLREVADAHHGVYDRWECELNDVKRGMTAGFRTREIARRADGAR